MKQFFWHPPIFLFAHPTNSIQLRFGCISGNRSRCFLTSFLKLGELGDGAYKRINFTCPSRKTRAVYTQIGIFSLGNSQGSVFAITVLFGSFYVFPAKSPSTLISWRAPFFRESTVRQWVIKLSTFSLFIFNSHSDFLFSFLFLLFLEGITDFTLGILAAGRD